MKSFLGDVCSWIVCVAIPTVLVGIAAGVIHSVFFAV